MVLRVELSSQLWAGQSFLVKIKTYRENGMEKITLLLPVVKLKWGLWSIVLCIQCSCPVNSQIYFKGTCKRHYLCQQWQCTFFNWYFCSLIIVNLILVPANLQTSWKASDIKAKGKVIDPALEITSSSCSEERFSPLGFFSLQCNLKTDYKYVVSNYWTKWLVYHVSMLLLCWFICRTSHMPILHQLVWF